MGWTPLFLEMDDNKVLIVGSGEVGIRRTKRFLEAGANVVVIGNHVPDESIKFRSQYQTPRGNRKMG